MKVTLRQRRESKNMESGARDGRALSVAPGAPQRRQTDAGGIETTING
jgi:hypothetical protein